MAAQRKAAQQAAEQQAQAQAKADLEQKRTERQARVSLQHCMLNKGLPAATVLHYYTSQASCPLFEHGRTWD